MPRNSIPPSSSGSLEALYRRVYRQLRPRSHMPQFWIHFYPYANIDSKIRLSTKGDKITAKISDLLEGAPSSFQEALAHILLGKLYRKPIAQKFNRRYRIYVNSTSIRRQALVIQRVRGRKPISDPRGLYHHLEELFEELNTRFFHGLLARPILSWSRSASRQSLGHFDPAHNTIVISRIFDRPQVPRFLLEYVLYHEMLHLKYPAIYRSQRCLVHTPEFKQQERLFPGYDKVVRQIRQL